MTLHEQSEIARIMTGSTLTDNEILKQVQKTRPTIKAQSAKDIDSLVKKYDAPFDKAFPKMKDNFDLIAHKYQLDSAALFWIYMERLNTLH